MTSLSNNDVMCKAWGKKVNHKNTMKALIQLLHSGLYTQYTKSLGH